MTKSLTEESTAHVLGLLTHLKGIVIHFAFCDGCGIDGKTITASEFGLQQKPGTWIIISCRRRETIKGNAYFEFVAKEDSKIPGIRIENEVMISPFVDIRICQPSEVITSVSFEKIDEQNFEPGLIYENAIVLQTSRGRIFKFEPEETVAERIRLVLP